MLSNPSIQETFINDLITNKSFISIYLLNGIRLKGHLIGQDEACVFLKADQQLQMIYKHRISTVAPPMTF